MLHAEPLHVHIVPDALRQSFREVFAFLVVLLDSVFKRIRHFCFRIGQVFICAFMAEIMRLTFCEDDVPFHAKERHDRMDVAPKLLLQGNG